MSFFRQLMRYLNPIGGLLFASDVGKKASDASGLFNNLVGAGDSYLNSITGAGPTGRDKWQMEQEEALMDKQVENQRSLRQTEYQDRMMSMQQAGLNPMMAAGVGPSSGNAAAGSSPSAGIGSLSDLFQLAALPAQIDLMKAQAEQARAGAKDKESHALVNQSLVKEVNQRIEESKARIAKTIAETDNEYKKGIMIEAQTALAYAQEHFAQVEATSVEQLRSSEIALNESRAKESAAKAGEAKANAKRALAEAALASVNVKYQNGLIENGMCSAVVNKIVAETNLADKQAEKAVQDALREALVNSKRTGTYNSLVNKVRKATNYEGDKLDEFMDGLMSGIVWFADEVKIM